MDAFDTLFGDQIVPPKYDHLLSYDARVRNRIRVYDRALLVLTPSTSGGR